MWLVQRLEVQQLWELEQRGEQHSRLSVLRRALLRKLRLGSLPLVLPFSPASANSPRPLVSLVNSILLLLLPLSLVVLQRIRPLKLLEALLPPKPFTVTRNLLRVPRRSR